MKILEKNILKRIGAWLKERVRKFFVALKKNPQLLPLLALLIAFAQFSLNLTTISKATLRINKDNVGLAVFVTMLFLILSFVCMLNAFPKRQKPKIAMIIILMVLYAAVIVADVHYVNVLYNSINDAKNPIKINEATQYIQDAHDIVYVNIYLVAITVVSVLIEPLYAKLIRKIKTSIDVEGSGDIEVIELSDED